MDLEVAPLSDLAVSLYLPRDTGAPANHTVGLHTAYISKGNVAGSRSMPEPTTMFAYAWLAGIDVAAPRDAYTVVALGDSITDGFATTRDANLAWPTLLAKRLKENKSTQHVAVVNQGISGNQVLRDGAGISALARLDRDVLTRPGVKWVILLEGINDINIRTRPNGPNPLTAEELIWGYRQIIERCHAQGIKVMGATLTPAEGVPTYSERGEEVRVAANRWIRAKGNFDAVVDFDAILRDRAASGQAEGRSGFRRPHSSERRRQSDDGRRVRSGSLQAVTSAAEGRKNMKSIKVFGILACVLCLGQALVSAISAQAAPGMRLILSSRSAPASFAAA